MTQDLHELVAPYALDALDDDERDRFERHLAECERCSAQLAELQEAAAALAFAAEGPAPPPALRGRILDAARGERRAEVVPLPRRRWALPAAAAVAAVAACAAIGLGLWAASLSHSLDRERNAAKKITVTPLTHAKGSLVVGDGGAALVVCSLRAAPVGKTYEAWVIRGRTPTRAGLFRGGGNCPAVSLTRPVHSGTLVAVTLERAGGVDKPTGRILFSAKAA